MTSAGQSLAPPIRLGSGHDLQGFDSGVPALDDWLKRRARHNEAEGASRTFVLCASQRVVGYYSLGAGSVVAASATGRVRRNMPDPVPVVLLGRLAIDQAWQGKGLGPDLLRDAVLRVIAAGESIGVRALLVHATSDAAGAFYQRHGFATSPLDPLTLMITLNDARRTLAVTH